MIVNINKKGIAIVTVLSVMSILMLVGVVATYLIFNETQMTKTVKDSTLALKAAEAGVERALARLLKSNLDNGFSGNLDTAFYSVSVSKISQDGMQETYEILSTGTVNNASRKIRVQIVVERSGIFKPFAADGEIQIDKIKINKPFASLLEMWAANGFQIADYDEINNLSLGSSYLQSSWNINFVYDQAFTPSVKSLSLSIPTSQINCDLGNFSSDLNSISGVNDTNNDGKIVICGNNVTIDDSLIINDSNYYDSIEVYAQNNIDVQDEIKEKDSGHEGNSFNVLLVAQDGDITFEDDAKIEQHGKSDTYNITVYAGKQIIINSKSSFIDVTGRATSNEEGGVLIVAGEGIVTSEDYWSQADAGRIHITGKEDTNLLIWSDGDIELKGVHFTGSNEDNLRTLGFIAHSDDPENDPHDILIKKFHLTGSENKAGITVEDLQNWYQRADGLTKTIISGILQQIQAAGANTPPQLREVKFWRVE